jgi:sugar phosphate isomerase/epimerase
LTQTIPNPPLYEDISVKLACFQSNRGLRQLDFQAFVKQTAALGYEAIDVPPQDPTAAKFCRAQGLAVNAAGNLFLPDLSTEESQQEEILQQSRQAIDIAAAQDVAVVVTLIGRDMRLNGDENIALYKEIFTPIASHAESKGVRLAFENWPRNGTMLAVTPELWDAMFNAVPSNAIGLCYDPSHLLWMGIDYIGPIRDFHERIYHAHAKDTEILSEGRNRFGIYGRQLSATSQLAWWRYRLPGYGQVDWTRYIDTLYQIGYDGLLSVEHEDPMWDDTPERALRGLQLTRQFLRQFLV